MITEIKKGINTWFWLSETISPVLSFEIHGFKIAYTKQINEYNNPIIISIIPKINLFIFHSLH